jgi:hypothetical protein
MSDEPRKGSRAWIGWVLIAALVLYPLSMGPAWRAAPAIYAPVVWASEHCEPFHEAMNWYLRFWGDGIYFLLDSDSVIRPERKVDAR